ncbi:unnamed protein product [Urochloa decumbens]|uniref:Uncharacterized protein n=1 Tax=Urochloa decumbens TaxID=240449 RepID=A0ABC8WMU2_9POAL
MGRGGSSGARVVVVEGEVHVEGAEKVELVKNGIPPPTATTRGVVPWLTPGTGADGKAAVPDVNELAAAFIRRSKEAFQGIRSSNMHVTAKRS